jgi:AAA domain
MKGDIMSIADPARNGKSYERALRNAHALTRMGVPVFAGRLDSDGNPDSGDKRWRGWQNKQPSHRAVDAWRPGEALCAVTGVVFDVLDWDPRNDPDERSWNRLVEALGDKAPFKFWEVRTPRGGSHIWVGRMDIGKHTGFLPGLDLQGGLPDGSGRGFVFLPPTERNGGVYRPTSLLKPYGDNHSVGGLRDFVLSCLDSSDLVGGSGANGTRRSSLDSLRSAVLSAEAGEQRGALLKLVHEYERLGTPREVIKDALRTLLRDVPVYDPRRPWLPARNPDKWINGLFHRSGRVIPDAEPGELDGLSGPIVLNGDRPISADDVAEEKIEWLNDPFLPFGCIVIMDGDPAQGKSVITTGMVARAASGLPVLPFGHPWDADTPIHCGMIGAEDDLGQAVVPRLLAAGYKQNRHVWFMGLKRDRKNRIEMLTFPNGTERVRSFINANGLRLLIIDPISAFIGEKIQTHNEASVRSALAPLTEIARDTGCCIVLVRHLNKDGSMKALYRGTGSIAFSAIARSGIICGTCPDGQFGLAQVKASYSELFPGVVRYSLAKTERAVTVEWGEVDAELTADDLVRGKTERKGPDPERQEMVREVLEPMFAEKDTWTEKECTRRINAAGIRASDKTIRKVTVDMGIRRVMKHSNRRGRGNLVGWIWTTRKPRVSDGS